jgi:hypothetical protein
MRISATPSSASPDYSPPFAATSGVPKKSRHWGHADGIINYLCGSEPTGPLDTFDAKWREVIPNPPRRILVRTSRAGVCTFWATL